MQDGTTVTVPDDTTEAEMNDVFDRHDRAQNTRADRDAFDSGSALEQFGVGVAKPVIKTYLGIKSLLSSLSPSDRDALDRLAQTHGLASGAGEVAGNLALMAAPGGAAARAAKVVSMFPRSAAALADIGANAGMEALKQPENGQTRSSNAAGAALGAVAGRAVAPAVRLGRAAMATPLARAGLALVTPHGSVLKALAPEASQATQASSKSALDQFMENEAARSTTLDQLRKIAPLLTPGNIGASVEEQVN
jgi:hypothetical protein